MKYYYMIFLDGMSCFSGSSWYKCFVVFDGVQQTELTFGQGATGTFGKDLLGLGIFDTITILHVDFSDSVWHSFCIYVYEYPI
jgi:hypothetical protein